MCEFHDKITDKVYAPVSVTAFGSDTRRELRGFVFLCL